VRSEEKIYRDKKQSPEKQIILEPEPEEKRQEKTQEEIVKESEGLFRANLPEYV
jgi:hypothetical protein